MKTQIRDKVNAAYGYNAITRINITQTAEIGFEFTKIDISSEEKDWDPNPSITGKKVKTSQQGKCARQRLKRSSCRLGRKSINKI